MKTKYLIIIIAFLSGCMERPEYPLEPIIKFVSINKTEIGQGPQGVSLDGEGVDSLKITFSFTDGDGNIDGIEGNDTLNGLQVIDMRDGFPVFTKPIRLPEIEYAGVSNGISGELEFIISNADFCCKNENIPNKETCEKTTNGVTEEVVFQITLSDHSGNVSNPIETPPITINCWY